MGGGHLELPERQFLPNEPEKSFVLSVLIVRRADGRPKLSPKEAPKGVGVLMSADHTGEDVFWAHCEFRWSTGNRKLRTLTGVDPRTLCAARLPGYPELVVRGSKNSREYSPDPKAVQAGR